MQCLRRVPGGDWVAQIGRLKHEAPDRFLAAFEARQIGADKGIAQNISYGGQNIRGRGSGSVTAKGNECSELIAGVVLEKAGNTANQGLPEELEHVILHEVFAETENLQVAEERFDIAVDLTFTLAKLPFYIVVNNLIKNAVQYSGAGEILIQAHDNALIVSNPMTEKQSSATSLSNEYGYGLGLFIVQQVARQQGWSVEQKEQTDAHGENQFYVAVTFSS